MPDKNARHGKHAKPANRSTSRRASARIRKRGRKSSSSFIRAIKKHKLGTILIALFLFVSTSAAVIHHNAVQQNLSTGYEHSQRFDGYVIADGIDVSYSQGNSIDWRKVKKSGVDFVFVRAGYRGSSKGRIYHDPQFDANVRGAKDAGLLVGAYFFSQALSPSEAKKEADFLVKKCEPYDMDLPLVMDYETVDGGRFDKTLRSGFMTSEMLTSISLAFCDEMHEKGYESMVYGNNHFLSSRHNPEKLASKTNVWLAHYAHRTDYKYNYSFWQYSQEGTVPGISGTVDRDFWYFDPKNVTETRAVRPAHAKSISQCRIKLADRKFKFIGNKIEPKVTVQSGDTELREGIDYRVGYINNNAPGTAYAMVTGIGKYKDTVFAQFKIEKLI